MTMIGRKGGSQREEKEDLPKEQGAGRGGQTEGRARKVETQVIFKHTAYVKRRNRTEKEKKRDNGDGDLLPSPVKGLE